MYERILVPLDGSAAAERVLPYAEEIAAHTGAALHLVTVLELTDADLDNVYRPYLEHLVDQVEMDIGGFKPKKETAVSYDILIGRAAAEIIRYAEDKDVKLIAMAATGRSGEQPWLMGNVAARVIRGTTRSVLLVRRAASEEAIQQKRLIKKVLVPLDGSELGESAIPMLEELAKSLDFDVVLVNVLEPIVTASVPGLAAVTVPTATEEVRREQTSLAYLDRVETELKGKGLTVSSRMLSGSAAAEIIRFADENAIDLVAMSTHGRSGMGRWVFGSVTDKVLHAGHAPILAVRAAKR